MCVQSIFIIYKYTQKHAYISEKYVMFILLHILIHNINYMNINACRCF